MRQLVVLPLLYFCFAVLSLTILASIAPSLVFLQFIYFVVGAIVFGAVSHVPFSHWRHYHILTYLASVALLALTLMLGFVHKGATRWIPIGPFSFQPSQFAQPLTIITLSFFLAHFSMRKFTNVFWYAVIILVPWFLTFIEPNLSTSLIFLFFAFFMALCKDLPYRYLAGGLLLAIVLGIIGWIFVIQPYQKQRILSFIAPDESNDSNYNARQSMIAVGSGQIFGRGLGHGVQSQLRFLPERQTDFVFASLAEELGLVGSLITLFLYGALFVFLYYKITRVKEPLLQSILIGFLSFFCIQVTINIGMNIGLLPITGITLPFLSYGGSSLLSFALSFGILQRVIIETDHKQVFQIR